ncbi:MAG TPA: response regulator transcription factor [Terriglobales bacterium]|jgi:DNA-binding NarL/FixJ family response regulator|nr:response regulator transcription factor [Terriglobales bacterium]
MSSGGFKPATKATTAIPEQSPLPANGADAASGQPEITPATIKIILADTQAIYRVGTKKIFALEDDIRVVAQAENLGQVLAAAAKFPADVLLFEGSISPNPPEAISEVLKRAPNLRVIVLSPENDEDTVVEFFRRGVRGLLPRSIAPEMLVKCVRKVFAGETWLDNQGVNWVIEAYRAQAAQLTSPRPKTKLSDKELLIISCVTQGMRNKEIANEIGTTEQVVKNYLRKVYDKLGVSDRLELALYCIHHRLLQGSGRGQIPEESAAAVAANIAAITE